MNPHSLTWYLHFTSVHFKQPLATESAVARLRNIEHEGSHRGRDGEGGGPVPGIEADHRWRIARPAHLVVSIVKEHVCRGGADGNDALECVDLYKGRTNFNLWSESLWGRLVCV